MANIPEFKDREDKLSPELEGLAKDFLFDEFSTDYISSMGLDYLLGVAVPFRASDLVAFKNGGLSVTQLADNMVIMLGVNTRFPHRDGYIKFLATFFDESLIDVICSKGQDALLKEQFRTACVYYRAALVLSPKDRRAMFGYACCCREWYLSMEGEDEAEQLIAVLKAESTEYYEYCVLEYPDFDGAYYYLGYAYLNAALYTKAQFVWNKFLQLDPEGKEQVDEIKERLAALDEPVKIEGGINKLLAGRYEEGLKILEPYVESSYAGWWPLHYYLGSAYRELGHIPEAIEGFKRVIALAPSNLDANMALAELYEEAGQTELAQKYAKKCELLSDKKLS